MFQYNAADKSKLLLLFQWTKGLATLLPQHNSNSRTVWVMEAPQTQSSLRWTDGIKGSQGNSCFPWTSVSKVRQALVDSTTTCTVLLINTIPDQRLCFFILWRWMHESVSLFIRSFLSFSVLRFFHHLCQACVAVRTNKLACHSCEDRS